VNFDENLATLDYRWHPKLLTQLERKSAELLIAPEDQVRMLAYAEKLDALLKRHARGSTRAAGGRHRATICSRAREPR